MEYKHGKPGAKALAVRETTLEGYEKYVREYVPQTVGQGSVEVRCDTKKDWILWSPDGPIRPSDPPPRFRIRFIHKVTATHRWNQPGTEGGAETNRDDHIFYFDATEACPEEWKEHLEESAGFEREGAS